MPPLTPPRSLPFPGRKLHFLSRNLEKNVFMGMRGGQWGHFVIYGDRVQSHDSHKLGALFCEPTMMVNAMTAVL